MQTETELTPMQQAFAVALVENGGNGTAAARTAGYADASARVLAHRLVRHPGVQAEIRARQWQLVNGPLASASLNVLRQALDMSNEGVPWSARIEAAKTVLDRSGLTVADHPDRRPPEDAAKADLSVLLGRLMQARELHARKASAIESSA